MCFFTGHNIDGVIHVDHTNDCDAIPTGPEQSEVPGDAGAVQRCWFNDRGRHHQPQCIVHRHDDRGTCNNTVLVSILLNGRNLSPLDSEKYALPRI